MTDIVERLRDPANVGLGGPMLEAAREIERLRAELGRSIRSDRRGQAEINRLLAKVEDLEDKLQGARELGITFTDD